jgi:hypothetical protein
MTQTTPPSSLDQASVVAYQTTIIHHGNVIQRFSANFVNIFALFNAGAFSASMAILPTQLGAQIFAGHPNIYKTIMTLFAVGFVTSGLLMIMIFDYSLHKYWEYRDALAAGRPFIPLPRIGTDYKFTIWAWFFFGTTVTSTLVATGATLLLFYTL